VNHLNNSIGVAELNALKEKFSSEELEKALEKIKQGYPIQYLIGNVNFFGNEIIVDENVLIPRYETEFLIDLISKKINKDFTGRILDIATGSGCIAISLSKLFPNAQIDALDISKDAINIAKKNKEINKANNVEFFVKDIFDFQDINNYEIIVSNPPYVSYDEEVDPRTKYEPQSAIFAADEGLLFYREILSKIKEKSNVKDIFFEIGCNQADKIQKIAKDNLNSHTFNVYQDLNNKDRYVHIKFE